MAERRVSSKAEPYGSAVEPAARCLIPTAQSRPKRPRAFRARWPLVLGIAFLGAALICPVTLAVPPPITGSIFFIHPTAVAFDPKNHYLYIADSAVNQVTVLSGLGTTRIATVPVGLAPSALAYDPGTDEMDVANAGSGTVSQINSSFVVVGTVAVGSDPMGLAYDPFAHEMFVANNGSGNVTVIPDTPFVGPSSIGVGTGPRGILYDPPLREMLVANSGSENISVINPARGLVISTIAVGPGIVGVPIFGPTSLAFDPTNKQIYAADPGAGQLSLISADHLYLTGSRNLTGGPLAVAYDPLHQTVAVSLYDANALDLLGTPYPNPTGGGLAIPLVGQIGTGSQPTAVAFDPIKHGYVVVNGGGGGLTYYNGWAAQASSVGGSTFLQGPQLPVYDSYSNEWFIPDTGSSSVSVFTGGNTPGFVTELAAGSNPWQAVYDPANGDVYVSNALSDNVTVYNGSTNTVVTNIGVGNEPLGLKYDALDQYVLVANFFSNNLSVIDASTNSVIYSIGTGDGPFAISGSEPYAFDAVTNFFDGNISAVQEKGWNGARWGPFVAWNQAVCAYPEGVASIYGWYAYNTWISCSSAGDYVVLSASMTSLTATITLPGSAAPSYSNPCQDFATPTTIALVGIGTGGDVYYYDWAGTYKGYSVVGTEPSGLGFDTVHNVLEVTDMYDDTLTTIG